MSAHTKLPWELHVETDVFEGDEFPIVATLYMAEATESHGHHLAVQSIRFDSYIDCMEGAELVEAMANLRLITAAPHLKAALEKLRDAVPQGPDAPQVVKDALAEATLALERVG